jgi:DNA polymerase III delta prime subunit
MDDQKFEEFCTDLLSLHPEIDCLRHGSATTRRIVKADRLLSGTDQRGSDIHATADQGEQWRLQCKHVQRFDSKKASKAMDLAEKGFPLADQFVLVTSCGLKDAVQQTIRDRPKWLWWGPSHLTNLAVTLSSRKDAENLLERHFGLDVRGRFLPGSNQPLLNWRELFAETISPEGKRFHHGAQFIPQPDVLSRLEAFAERGAGRALILSAPGGQGKSRLLLELAKSLEGKPKAPRVFFLNLSSKGLDRDLADFLSREPKDLLLVVDDAHRLNAVMEDVARAATKLDSVRLLVATRPEAVAALESQLYNGGYAERLEKRIELFPWEQETVYKLAEEILKPEHRHQAARLAGLADKCPLLVVLGGAMLNSGEWPETMTNHEAFREKVFRSFKNDFLERQPEHQRERLDQLIKLLAFVSPTAKNDTFYNKAAEILGCPLIAIGEDLKALQAARLVVENREGIRLYPDLFADAVLLDACLDQKGQPSFLHRMILSKLQIADFPALMRNLAQADWETRSKTGETGWLFEPVWQEFVRRFQEAVWVSSWTAAKEWLVEPYVKGGPKDRRPDRGQLLSQWASFAVYLPEKTLELAKLALQSVAAPLAPADSTSASQAEIRSSVCTSVPALLKPIVTWHPRYADQALDILWSLDADEPKANWQHDSNAIAVIADAAGFAFQKPPATSIKVMDWLENTLQDSVALERFRRQPWILSALLKPFFGRGVELNWSTGRTFHMSSVAVAADKTRPLRQKALTIVENFLVGKDTVLCQAVVPLIEKAIRPLFGRFGSKPSKTDQQAWRPDRLEVLRIVERAAKIHQDWPILLLQLRDILRNRRDYDPDEVVCEECQRVLSAMPDTFELHVTRVLASFAHDEVSAKLGLTFDADLKAAETQWAEFRLSVAREVVDQFKTAKEVCEFISRQVRDLGAIKHAVLGGALLEPIAQISPVWCAGLLEELLRTSDPALDGFLWPILGEAARHAPKAYHKATESLPDKGRPEQLCALVSFLGRKQLHGEGLTESERQCVLASTKRTEEAVVAGLASTTGLFFANDPQWAIEVLNKLKPGGERDASEIIQALGLLAEKHSTLLDPAKVAQCLTNVGDLCFSDRISEENHLEQVAQAFPKQVYEHARDFYRRTEAKPAEERSWGASETIALGSISDDEYVDREIQQLWKEAVSIGAASMGQHFRLDLIRSLLGSGAAAAPSRLQRLIAACGNGDELKLAAKLAATQGSRFVFEFPDIVRLLLTRSLDLAVADAVHETLWLSACGGGRGYTNHELDPEYRYILEQGEALANRYRDDAILHKFYRMVAESERRQAEWNKRTFQDDDDLD